MKNESFLAAILNTRGDVSFFGGDVKSADKSYRSALQIVSRSREDEVTLLSKLNVARVAVAEGRFQEAMRSLQTLLNPKGGVSANLSLQIQLAMAQAAIGMKDYARADYILEQQLATAKRSGIRFDLARIYYLLGTSARLSGSADRASDYYREAAQLLDVIRSDSGDKHPAPDRFQDDVRRIEILQEIVKGLHLAGRPKEKSRSLCYATSDRQSAIGCEELQIQAESRRDG